MKVILDADGQDRFRSEAKKSFSEGVEYMEALGGYEGVGEFHIARFYPIKIITGQTDGGQLCIYTDEVERKRVHRQIRRDGFQFLGYAHTHIDCDSAPSKKDHVNAPFDQEKIIGILEMWQDKNGKIYSRWDFWQPQAPMTIEYRTSIPPAE
jgi:hypothetical protein